MTQETADGRRRRQSSGKPNPIDVHVGGRVRLRRTLLGMSQERLGQALGLTFQQVQKYERGANRIGASRLHRLSEILDVPVAFFFDELKREPEKADAMRSHDAPATAPVPAREGETMMRRETLELVRAYYRIGSPQVRRRLFDLTKAIANATESS
ncbi:MAG TPA: helix-turn-helix transcriptional regulator [Stellaceae bacterium]|nr:helix-turn-helix transcriptional regulator [Stellaceae bacterium]